MGVHGLAQQMHDAQICVSQDSADLQQHVMSFLVARVWPVP
jgi:hypothetical protein